MSEHQVHGECQNQRAPSHVLALITMHAYRVHLQSKARMAFSLWLPLPQFKFKTMHLAQDALTYVRLRLRRHDLMVTPGILQ